MNIESVVDPLNASSADAVVDQRNPLLRPFSSDSIWNQPIGDAAEYVPAQLEGAFLDADTDHFFVLRADDPVQDLFAIGGWRNRSTSTREIDTDLPLPDALIIPDTNEQETPNNSAALLLPDGNTLVQLNAMTRDRLGGPVYGVKYPFAPHSDATLDGDGALGGHGGSGLSSIGGTIRIGELAGDDPIRHALKINLWAKKYLSYTPGVDGGLGYRWPAIKADSYADATTYGGTVPELVMGSLLALSPEVTPESLGIQTEPGKKLFYALQNYGAYVADDTAWDAHAIEVESGVLQEFEYTYGYDFRGNSSPFHDDVTALFEALNVVNNNAADAVGGGGTPRVDVAPPIDPNAVAEVQALLADPTVEDTFEADFNGDGTLDLLWRNLAVGSMQAWLRDETGEIIGGGNILPLASWDWQIVDTPDVDSDGRADLLWRDRVTGAEQVWYLDDLRLWIDPATGNRVARWIETASGLPRIETFGSSLLPDTTRQYEAESLTINGYAVIEDSRSGASNDQFVSLHPTATDGSISGVFDGSAGLYQVELLAFDQTDGEASLTVTVADEHTALVLDGEGADRSASPLSPTQRVTHDAIALQTGDPFTITGTVNGDDLASVDAIVFTPIANTRVSITPTLAPPEDLVEPPITVNPAPELVDPAPERVADGPETAEALSFVDQVMTFTNVLREEEGLDPVTFDPTLATAAQRHADDMAQYGFFSHLGLNQSTPLSRVDAVTQAEIAPEETISPSLLTDGVMGWAIAENIGVGYTTPEAIVEAWATSPSHRSHLLNPAYDSIGIGYTLATHYPDQPSFTPYWTQLLGIET